MVMDALIRSSAGQLAHVLRTLTLATGARNPIPPLSQRIAEATQLLLQPSTIATIALAFIGYRTVQALFVSPLRHVPGPLLSRLSTLPSLFAGLTRSTNDDMIRDCERYGSVFVMEPRKVAICDPEDCRQILGSYAFVKTEHYSNVGFMEPNIFLTRSAELNKQRRRQLGPALSMKGVRKMETSILAAGAQQLISKWDEAIENSISQKTQVCYFNDLTLVSFDIIASLGFGSVHRSLTTGDHTIGQWVEKTFALMITQMVLPAAKIWPLRGVVDYFLRQDVDDFFAFGRAAINMRKLELAKGIQPPADILQQFIDAEDPLNKVRMTSSQVLTETIMMLLSGADTTSTAMSWTIHMLMLYPEHYQALIVQIRSAFSASDLITYDMARTQLPLLEACIFESLRICPVSTNLPRLVPKGGVRLNSGHFIPEGYSIAVSTAAANYHPGSWHDPHRFEPSRFLPSNPQYDANRRNLMSMSTGVRGCPGRHLAMVEMTTVLANILNKYDLELPDNAIYTSLNKSKDGLPRIMPRTNLVAMIPKHPNRDCNVLISKRKI
ncbi:hypothetical protein H4R24_005293 [Coemansia sp. RSA 988]|nr:hypothetical protein H4R24_005293 [Coemansia sp. RSA 988]